DGLRDDKYFDDFLNKLEKEKIFKLHDEKNMDDEKIIAYIKDYDKVEFKKSGLYESIVESIINAYLRKVLMVEKILRKNPAFNLDVLTGNVDHIKNISKKNINIIYTFFYTLIAMQALYGFNFGLLIIYRYEANLSSLAKRNAIAPIKKSISLLASILAGFIINFSIVLFTILFFNKIYKIDFSNELIPLIFLIGLASLFGVLFGCLIGLSNKSSIEVKNGIGIAVSMLFSYLAGMMNSDVKIMVQENYPIINKLNPASLINDGIYSLYYYDNLDRYWTDIGYLLFLTLLFGLISYLLTRGRQYDSI
ncbi:MAG: ABC transporter permease, partial [Anaerococcus hydrogenalis]|nr:ABC transporter permease [Anaerococcus hydrogenalis]